MGWRPAPRSGGDELSAPLFAGEPAGGGARNTCPQCQRSNPPSARFCNGCGQELAAICPACRHANPPDSRFCGACGQGLVEERDPHERARSGVAPEESRRQPDRPAAERRQLSVMFCDLVGSMALSSRLDPEELREVIRAYQAACAAVIARFDGHVAQYLGDGLLAYFGYPQAHEDDARRATRAGLRIVEALGALNERIAQRYGVRLAVRVGIHSGLVVVDTGRGPRHGQLALGETPNLAAHLQAVAQPDTVVISGATQRLIHGLFATREVGERPLKGLPARVQVFEVLGEGAAESRLDALAMTGLTQLVGRDGEIGLLLDRWEQALEGHGQIVVLTGEPGIGKSRLVHVVKERIAASPHTRLECRCSPYYEQSPLYPVIDMLPRICGWKPDDAPDVRLAALEAELARYPVSLADTVPLLAALLSLPASERYPLPPMSPERQKRKTLDALIAALLAIAGEAPLLLIVEDLHWADPSTLELLTNLLDQVATARILAVFTARPSFALPWALRAHLMPLAVNRFTRKQTEVMIDHVAGGTALPAEVLRQIATKTDGVPLFVEELTRMVLESGLLGAAGEGHAIDGSLPSLAIPTTLQDSLMARLDRLSTAKDVIQLGAVLGRTFDYDLLRTVAPLDEEALRHELGRLVEADLLHPRGTPPRVTYTFKHALIQDAAYQALLKTTRQHYHQRVARALVDRFPEEAETRPEHVAHHYTAAGATAQAIDYWHRAGRRARARSAHAEAIAHFAKGLGLVQELPASVERARQELALRMPQAASLVAIKGGGATEVQRAYESMRGLCEETGDTAQLARVVYGLWGYHSNRAEHRTARALGEQLLELARRMTDPASLLTAHNALGTTLIFLGELAQARAHLGESMALAEAQGPHAPSLAALALPRVANHTYAAWPLWLLGYPDQALDQTRKSLALARELAHPFSLAVAQIWAAVLHAFRREDELVQEYAAATQELSTEQGFATTAAGGIILQGWTLVCRGVPDRGVAQMIDGLRAWRDAGSDLFQYWHVLIAEGHARNGDAGRGLAQLDEGFAVVEKSGEVMWEPELYRLKGELLLEVGREATEAEGCLREALAIARRHGSRSLELRAAMSLGRLWVRRGRRDDARRLLADIHGWFTEGLDTGDLQEAAALLAACEVRPGGRMDP